MSLSVNTSYINNMITNPLDTSVTSIIYSRGQILLGTSLLPGTHSIPVPYPQSNFIGADQLNQAVFNTKPDEEKIELKRKLAELEQTVVDLLTRLPTLTNMYEPAPVKAEPTGKPGIPLRALTKGKQRIGLFIPD